MLIKKEIIINADVKKVWKIFSDLEKWPEWSGYILKTKWISKEKWQPNAMFSQTTKGFGPVNQFVSKVKLIKVEPYKTIAWTGSRKLISGTHTFEFREVKNNTKVLNSEYFKGVLEPILGHLIKPKFEFYFEQFLDGLKKEAEKS